MEKTGFTLDTKEFDLKFPKITDKEIPEEMANSAMRVGAFILRDAIVQPPTVPKKSGHLRRQQVVERPKIERGEISVAFGFNTPYAARLHEAPSNWQWSEPGSGPKFLESKLMSNKEKYLQQIAEDVRRKGK